MTTFDIITLTVVLISSIGYLSAKRGKWYVVKYQQGHCCWFRVESEIKILWLFSITSARKDQMGETAHYYNEDAAECVAVNLNRLMLPVKATKLEGEK